MNLTQNFTLMLNLILVFWLCHAPLLCQGGPKLQDDPIYINFSCDEKRPISQLIGFDKLGPLFNLPSKAIKIEVLDSMKGKDLKQDGLNDQLILDYLFLLVPYTKTFKSEELRVKYLGYCTYAGTKKIKTFLFRCKFEYAATSIIDVIFAINAVEYSVISAHELFSMTNGLYFYSLKSNLVSSSPLVYKVKFQYDTDAGELIQTEDLMLEINEYGKISLIN